MIFQLWIKITRFSIYRSRSTVKSPDLITAYNAQMSMYMRFKNYLVANTHEHK